MGVIFDTSVLIEAERGRFDVDAFVRGREEEPFGLSVVTVAELLHGVHRADTQSRRLKRAAYVEKVIADFPIITFDVSVARIYASMWAALMAQGTTIGAHDLIIGSTALAHGFSVATFNVRHFERIEGLNMEILIPQTR